MWGQGSFPIPEESELGKAINIVLSMRDALISSVSAERHASLHNVNWGERSVCNGVAYFLSRP